MKRILLVAFLAGTFLFAAGNVTAQDLKFGHINTAELLQQMPERDSARAELQEYSQMLQQEMETLQVEYQRKVQQYMEKQETYSDLVRQSKEQELQDMQRRVQEFQSTAQQDYGQKEQELLQPIMEKAENAISRVGEKNGFIYIFDLSAGNVVYHSDKSENVMPLVKAELGL